MLSAVPTDVREPSVHFAHMYNGRRDDPAEKNVPHLSRAYVRPLTCLTPKDSRDPRAYKTCSSG
jgi:hypothetical protein